MITLKKLQSQYLSEVQANLAVTKNRKRYSAAFKADMGQYVSHGGDKARLAKWLGIGIGTLSHHLRKTDAAPHSVKEPVFIRVPEPLQESNELVITYPSGVTVRLPLKL